ncbi:uncharacterized protein [Aegilops tauschii subsp. strangulata]|uniref:uncharacterized protein n=1 Tax=Aegilops tauschii subsp. strangulata TaxID=200361 RepID=UPI003CC8A3EA
MWEREASLAEVVEAAWVASGAKGDLGGRTVALKATMAKLHGWSNRTIGNVTREIEKSRTRLEELHNMNADRSELRKESGHMDELLYKEEMMWLQRSRMEWLKHGDRNTKFFHRKARWRGCKNRIKGLRDDLGILHSEQDVMSGMAMSNFQNLFEADQGLAPHTVVNLFEPVITEEMNAKLCEAFSDKAISDALFQMGPLKAPGPDGFPARFFQRHWGMMKDDIIEAVR